MMASQPTLFTGATIISYDDDQKLLKTLRDASLLVENGRITQLAEGSLPDVPAGAEVIDAKGKIISPGFIDTHHHMWQSAFRTIAANTTLIEYLAGRYAPMGTPKEHFTPHDIYIGQMACALEMIDSGTTTVLDHAHGGFTNEHVDAAVEASFDSGLRIFFAHTVQSIQATSDAGDTGMNKLLQLSKDPRFADSTNPVELGVAYDAWAFVPSEANAKFVDLIVSHNNTTSEPNARISVLTTHFVGGPYGANNSPSLLDSVPTSMLSQSNLTAAAKMPVVFSHASLMTYNDARLIRSYPHVSISTTPESEAHYGHTSAGAELCQDCASLGVDTHFTFSTYMPFQARLWLQSLRYRRYQQTVEVNSETAINNPMECDAAFLLMTQKGGEALGRSDLGVIKVGAQADLVLIDTQSRAALWGYRDPVAAVVLHTGGGGDIEAVMVQGRWLKKDYKLLDPLLRGGETVPVAKLRDQFEQSALRIQKIWEDLEPPVFTEGEPSMSGAKYGRCKTVDVRRHV